MSDVVDVPSLKLTIRPLKNCGWKTIFLLGTSIFGAILNFSFNRQGITYASTHRIFIHIYFVVMTVSDLQVSLMVGIWNTGSLNQYQSGSTPDIPTSYIYNSIPSILPGSLTNPPLKNDLVGGFNPVEKYARQNGNLSQVGVENKIYLKPPPSDGWKTILSVLGCFNFSGANC